MIQALLRIPRMRGKAILAALPAVLREQEEQAAFRSYIADTLYYHGENKRLTKRYSDIIDDTETDKPLTPDEADAMAARLGIRFTKGGKK